MYVDIGGNIITVFVSVCEEGGEERLETFFSLA